MQKRLETDHKHKRKNNGDVCGWASANSHRANSNAPALLERRARAIIVWTPTTSSRLIHMLEGARTEWEIKV